MNYMKKWWQKGRGVNDWKVVCMIRGMREKLRKGRKKGDNPEINSSYCI